MRKVLLLGSTGSIGTSALKVARDIPERMQIVGLAANSSVEALVEQVRETGVKQVALTDPAAAAKARALLTVDPNYLAAVNKTPDAIIASFAGLAGPYAFTPDEPDLVDMFGPPWRYPAMQATTFITGREPPIFT